MSRLLTERICWICLGGENDPPPLGNLSEAKDFVTPCRCSLTAHRRCLLDWIGDLKLNEKSDAGFDGFNLVIDLNMDPNGAINQNQNIFNQNNANNGNNDINNNDNNNNNRGNLRTNSIGIHSNHYVKAATCLQCTAPIMISLKPSFTLGICSLIKKLTSKISSGFLLGGLGASVFFGIISMGFITANVVGFSILNKSIPPSILSRLFNLPSYITLERGISENYLDAYSLSKITLFPLFLIKLRSSTLRDEFLINSYIFHLVPFDIKSSKSILNNFKGWLTLVTPFRCLYSILFKLTLNRIYYKWTYSIRPCFIADSVSEETLKMIEIENRVEEEYNRVKSQNETQLKHKDIEQSVSFTSKILSLFRKAYRFCIPDPNDLEGKIKSNRRRREIVNCLSNDYSKIFATKSSTISHLTTFLWPVLGAKIGAKLFDFRFIRYYTNLISNSPDESLFACNLIGCILLVFVKDVFNLFLVWRKVKQLQDIQILDGKSKQYEISSQEVVN